MIEVRSLTVLVTKGLGGRMPRGIARVRRQDEGASAVEYGILIAAIAAVLVFATVSLGSITRDLFTDGCQQIEAQPSVGSTGTCSNEADDS
jgi:pilus assembly protein Flp/PilA